MSGLQKTYNVPEEQKPLCNKTKYFSFVPTKESDQCEHQPSPISLPCQLNRELKKGSDFMLTVKSDQTRGLGELLRLISLHWVQAQIVGFCQAAAHLTCVFDFDDIKGKYYFSCQILVF